MWKDKVSHFLLICAPALVTLPTQPHKHVVCTEVQQKILASNLLVTNCFYPTSSSHKKWKPGLPNSSVVHYELQVTSPCTVYSNHIELHPMSIFLLSSQILNIYNRVWSLFSHTILRHSSLSPVKVQNCEYTSNKQQWYDIIGKQQLLMQQESN